MEGKSHQNRTGKKHVSQLGSSTVKSGEIPDPRKTKLVNLFSPYI